jgi:hypothetical protein
MKSFIDNHSHTITNGVTGMLASVTGFWVTLVQQLELWVRFSTAILCLVIAIITLHNLIKKGRN